MRWNEKSSAAFFEAKYQERSDYWDFAGSPPELHRYSTIMAALPKKRYVRAFEPGCSVGVLTERLGTMCDAVEAIDFSQIAVAQASRRCMHLPSVKVSCESFAEKEPEGVFDLIIFSEIGYYFEPQQWKALTDRWIELMPQASTVLASHWLGLSSDHRTAGDQVHEILHVSPLLCLERSERHGTFRVRCWLANTDADCEVPAEWLNDQLALVNRGAYAVAGTVDVDSFEEHEPSVKQLFRLTYVINADGTHPHVHGANFGVRADAYLGAGGWTKLATGEDHDLWNRLQRAGYRPVSDAGLQVITSGRRTGRAPAGFADALLAHNSSPE